jgi:hypothetical protein
VSAAPRMVFPAALVGIALAASLGVVRFVNTEPPVRTAEWLGTLAFGVLIAAPAVLALLGLTGRPALILAGGALGIFLAAIGAASLFSLALIIPSVVYLVGAAQLGGWWPGAPRTAAAVLLSLALGWGALMVLFFQDNPICWAQVSRHGGSSYVRLPAEQFVRENSISMSSEDLPRGSTLSGCAGDSISPLEAASSFALSAIMLGAAWTLGTPRSSHDSVHSQSF